MMITANAVSRAVGMGFLLLACWTACAADVIRREVSIKNGGVCVTDFLSISGSLAVEEPNLDAVYEAGVEGNTDFVQKVGKLLNCEDLHIEECKQQIRGQSLEVEIVSTVRFGASNHEAMIHLVSTFGGDHAGRQIRGLCPRVEIMCANV
jgi:hypothetical protein